MKKTVTLSDFVQEFVDFNREDNFSREGLEALFYYLENLEDETGSEIELDCIALCCEFTEYKNLKEFHENYSKEEYPNLESVEDETQVIRINDEAFIIQNF